MNMLVNADRRVKRATLLSQSGSLFIVKAVIRGTTTHPNLSQRNGITCLSASAAVRMRRYLRECRSDYRVFITITYPYSYPCDGRLCKEHLRRFLQELRRDIDRRGGDGDRYSSFWFLEFQERGAPHFHIFTTDEFNKRWVARTWYRIVGSEDDRHLRAGTRIESIRAGRAGTISYASKYAAKEAQKLVPDNFFNVGRFWGVNGNRSVVAATTVVSEENAENLRIVRRKLAIMQLITRSIADGRAHTYRRWEGGAVVIVNDITVRNKVRALIWMIEAETHDARYSLFNEAEVSD